MQGYKIKENGGQIPPPERYLVTKKRIEHCQKDTSKPERTIHKEDTTNNHHRSNDHINKQSPQHRQPQQQHRKATITTKEQEQ